MTPIAHVISDITEVAGGVARGSRACGRFPARRVTLSSSVIFLDPRLFAGSSVSLPSGSRTIGS